MNDVRKSFIIKNSIDNCIWCHYNVMAGRRCVLFAALFWGKWCKIDLKTPHFPSAVDKSTTRDNLCRGCLLFTKQTIFPQVFPREKLWITWCILER